MSKRQKVRRRVPWFVNDMVRAGGMELTWWKFILISCCVGWSMFKIMVSTTGPINTSGTALAMAIFVLVSCLLILIVFTRGLCELVGKPWLKRRWRMITGAPFHGPLQNTVLQFLAARVTQAANVGDEVGRRRAMHDFWFVHEAADLLGWPPRHDRFGDYIRTRSAA